MTAPGRRAVAPFPWLQPMIRRLFSSTGARCACLLALLAAAALPAIAQGPGAGAGATPPAGLPLKTARTHTFTTTKGTWISLDVSSDGQTIVFDLLGDIYTMPITGGTATRLTHGMAYDAQPRWSPDGKKIVFVSDRSGGENVWIMNADGKDTTALTTGNTNMYVSPAWAPDGKYIVVSRSGGTFGTAKLYMYHVDGGKGVALSAIPAPPPTLKQLGAAVIVGSIAQNVLGAEERRAKKPGADAAKGGGDLALPLVKPGEGMAKSVNYVEKKADLKDDKLKTLLENLSI